METMKIRIALEVTSEGGWHAHGYTDVDNWFEAMYGDDLLNGKRFWIEVEVPVPAEAEPETLKGEAVPA